MGGVRAWSALGLGSWLVACPAAPESSTNDAGSSRPVGTQSFVTLVPRSEVWLVVVDDTPNAQGLREALADRFDDYDAEASGSGCDGLPDPARWSPTDRSLVVVRPSQSGPARFESPATVPALHWQASHVTSADRLTWLSAVRAALTRQVPSGPTLPLLEATAASVALLDGDRSPANDDEFALLQSVPFDADRALVVASASEDQSPLAPSAYGLPDLENAGTSFYSLIVGANSSCTAPTPRLGNWAEMERDELPSKVQLWPCAPGLEPLWDFFCDGVEVGLPNNEVKLAANGFAECSVTSEVPAGEACPAEYGWLDPIGADGTRSPRLSSTATGLVRACEIEQLTGAALAGCRSSYTCADCEPGWCFTDVPELTKDSPGMTMRWPLGADLGNPSAVRTLRCQSPH
jgi:hypothetical protein